MPKIGQYDHLEETQPVTISLNMVALVATVECTNYGTHRFLSEVVRQRLARRPHDRMALAIQALLNDGCF